MKLTLSQDQFLRPLQRVIGAVERRQTVPILGNVLISLRGNTLSVTATDMEIELNDHLEGVEGDEGQFTVPARKLLDIVKSLMPDSELKISVTENRATITSGRSRFSVATLPAREFPSLEQVSGGQGVRLTQKQLKSIIERTAFAMAIQDVRYYLNGLLMEISENDARAVATDGHRLSWSQTQCQSGLSGNHQVIIPRKGVMEMMRMLKDSDDEITLQVSANHIRLECEGMRFTSKLIDGKFPDYQRVIPQNGNRSATVNKSELQSCLNRVAILSNEKYRGVRMQFSSQALTVQTNNPEQEEAEESVSCQFDGDNLEIGFNVNYVQDALAAINGDTIVFQMGDTNTSCLILDANEDSAKYVVMPIRL